MSVVLIVLFGLLGGAALGLCVFGLCVPWGWEGFWGGSVGERRGGRSSSGRGVDAASSGVGAVAGSSLGAGALSGRWSVCAGGGFRGWLVRWLLGADFREVVRVAVARELSDRQLRNWQVEAAARDAWLEAAQCAGERAARDEVRRAWRGLRSDCRAGGAVAAGQVESFVGRPSQGIFGRVAGGDREGGVR